ncbi:MAG TPA: ABC transporter substrate-binding protein [Thermotogota bacterium]|nr:ABC transporter substrate-binding protein [Thermotogota bacterium]HRW93005.1 ABC transporter substrate-binding protein [Thermotogota bacterium]
MKIRVVSVLLVVLLSLSLFAASPELVSAAKAEGKVVVYSITSRIKNAAEAFQQKYGIEVEAYNLKGFELIEKVSKEVGSGIVGADFVIAQDGGRVFGELIEPGYLINYIPPDMADVIAPDQQNPLMLSTITKVFLYNSETYTFPPATNIWALADPAFKGRYFFKDPFQEGVNMNFLTMITREDWAQKIEKAYERYYGEPLQLTTENAGYEWIKRVLENGLVLMKSDTTMAESLGIRGQQIDKVGLCTYSKVRYRDTKNLALLPIMGMEPFAGFYYPSYLMLVENAAHPNAAKLFIEYLLTEEGFTPWSDSEGTYSPNPNILPYPGDNGFNVWGNILVGEDPEFLFENRIDVEEFWNEYAY